MTFNYIGGNNTPCTLTLERRGDLYVAVASNGTGSMEVSNARPLKHAIEWARRWCQLKRSEVAGHLS